jgi:hypothetical protein
MVENKYFFGEGYFKNANQNIFVTNEKLLPGIDESIEVFSKRIEDPSFGNIDFRALKSSQLSNSMANKMLETINGLPELKGDCSKNIADATQLLIKECKLFNSNKAHNINPSKWFLEIYESSKYLCIGKTVAIDLDSAYFFEELGLQNRKDREEKLSLVTNYHNALKSRNNKSIKYNNDVLNAGYFSPILNKGVDLLTAMAHRVYWKPIYYSMIDITQPYFGTIPASDWFLYPIYARMVNMFSVNEPNIYMSFGPPINLLKNPPFAGEVICDIGVYVKYSVSFFGGRLSFERNGKKYN